MNKKDIEELDQLNLRFDKAGLLPAVVQEAGSGEILMLAYVNQEAFAETIKSGYATFWSRSRNELWKKGEISGNRMKITDVLVDCDQDCLIYQVEKTNGGACHTHNKEGEYRNSCFYRKVDIQNKNLLFLED